MLLQNQVRDLQVKYDSNWIDLKPMILNDAYKSGEHRVCANNNIIPRVPITVFFSPGIEGNLYGPMPEQVTSEKPALYRQLIYSGLVKRFLTTLSTVIHGDGF
ncbi:1-aminocyclopropane-1-carboxylate oxidase-like protein 5 [Bienertia sinuspersici]